jgi:hypothetical protein
LQDELEHHNLVCFCQIANTSRTLPNPQMQRIPPSLPIPIVVQPVKIRSVSENGKEARSITMSGPWINSDTHHSKGKQNMINDVPPEGAL